MGDLGISVKMDPKDKDGTESKYEAKGMTPGFVTEEYVHAMKQSKLMSK